MELRTKQILMAALADVLGDDGPGRVPIGSTDIYVRAVQISEGTYVDWKKVGKVTGPGKYEWDDEFPVLLREYVTERLDGGDGWGQIDIDHATDSVFRGECPATVLFFQVANAEPGKVTDERLRKAKVKAMAVLKLT